MITFLIFYYFFSVFFSVGYDSSDADYASWKWFEIATLVIFIIALSPIMLPYNLGRYIYENQ